MIGTSAKTGITCMGFGLLLAAVSSAAAEPEPETPSVVPVKVWRHAERWMVRYDADGDGSLTEKEWPRLADSPGAADANRDGSVTAEELAQHLADFGRHRKIRLMPASVGGVVPLPSLLPPSLAGAKRPATPGEEDRAQPSDDEPAENADAAKNDSPQRSSDRKYVVSPSRLPPGLPDWFLKRDSDGDGQLTLAEYAEPGSASADKEFARYDRNHDGLVTPAEVVAGTGGSKRTKRSATAASQPEPGPAASGGDGKKEK